MRRANGSSGSEGALIARYRERSADGEKFYLENEGGIGRNRAGITFVAVGQFGRNGHLHFVARFHLRDALVPPGDDLSCAQNEAERFITIHGTVELAAIGKPARVMNGHRLS